MAIQKVTYDDKVDLQIWASIPNTNKIKAQDMNEIKGAINENADELSSAKDEIANQDSEIEALMNALPSETKEGETVNIKGTIPVKFKEFVVGGNNKQESRSGKNLFDKSKGNDYAYTNVSGTLKITELDTGVRVQSSYNLGSPTAVYKLIDLSNYVGKTVRAKVNIANSGSNVGRLAIGLCDADCTVRAVKTYTNSSNTEISFVAEDLGETTFLLLALYINSTGTMEANAYADFTDLIVTVDNSDMTYEDYGASPSPEYPAEIRNVGDNVNEFDVSKITNTPKITNNGDNTLTIANNANIVGAADTEKTLKQLCPNLKVGDVVTLNFKTTTQNADYKNSIYIGRPWSFGDTITLTETDLNTSVVLYGGYQETSVISEIKIEKGEQSTSYSPYGYGNVNISVYNKNLAYSNWAQILVDKIKNSDKAKVVVEDNRDCLLFSADAGYPLQRESYYFFSGIFKENTQYTISFDIKPSTGNANINVYYKDGTIGKNLGAPLTINKWQRVVYTTSAQKTVDAISPGYYSGASYIDLNSMQIEEGTVATDYVEHKEQVVNFPQAQGQKLMLGDYLAEDGIHHVRKQDKPNELDGWNINTVSQQTQINTISFRYQISNAINSDSKLCLSNLFKGYKTSEIYNVDKEGIWVDSNYLYVRINRSRLDTEDVEGFENFLAKNNIIVEYPLAEEEIEAYTPEQQTAYNKICNLKAYEGETNIFSTNEISTIFKVTAVKDFNSIITQINQQILEIAGGN